MRWYLRSCPVCAGDVYEDPDRNATAPLTCLQCGRSLRRTELVAVIRPTETERPAPEEVQAETAA